MPNVWTKSSLDTPGLLKDRTPAEQKRALSRWARQNGAGLDEVYFDVAGNAVYALFHVPGDDADTFASAVGEALFDHDRNEPPEVVVVLTLEEYLDRTGD